LNCSLGFKSPHFESGVLITKSGVLITKLGVLSLQVFQQVREFGFGVEQLSSELGDHRQSASDLGSIARVGRPVEQMRDRKIDVETFYIALPRCAHEIQIEFEQAVLDENIVISAKGVREYTGETPRFVSMVTHKTFDLARYERAPRSTSGSKPSQSILM
jgi:hypothetical protein